MKKIPVLIFCLVIFANLGAQKKPNPKIGKKEIETTLIYLKDNRMFSVSNGSAFGGEAVYRLSWKKHTKVGAGALLTADYNRYRDVFAYAAVFADITQFIGRRQKWSVGGQFGHGIYRDKQEGENAVSKGFSKTTAGFYYSLSINYRTIVSKKFLLTISPFWFQRNFRYRVVEEYFSPPRIDRWGYIEQRQGLGLKLGIVF